MGCGLWEGHMPLCTEVEFWKASGVGFQCCSLDGSGSLGEVWNKNFIGGLEGQWVTSLPAECLGKWRLVEGGDGCCAAALRSLS